MNAEDLQQLSPADAQTLIGLLSKIGGGAPAEAPAKKQRPRKPAKLKYFTQEEVDRFFAVAEELEF